MNPTLHAQILTLRKYQAWRTGEDTRTMDDAGIVPAAVTIALDAVLEIAENHLRGETTTVTCQLYGHPLKTCAECNHELACSTKPVKVLNDAEDDIVDLLSEYACHNTEHGRMSFDKWTLRDAVSALLAKYGQNTACCRNPSQCWEPCGDLGNSLEHARVAETAKDHQKSDALNTQPSATDRKEIMKPALERADLAFIYDELRQSGKDRAAELVRAALLAKHGQPTLPYNLDADPAKIRALAADAIRGAIGFGIQGTNPPPDGHWLAEFWRTGEALG